MTLLNIIGVVGDYIEATVVEPFRAITDAFAGESTEIESRGGVSYLLTHLKKQRELCSPELNNVPRYSNPTPQRVIYVISPSEFPRRASGRGAFA